MHTAGDRAFQRLDPLGRGEGGQPQNLVAAVGRHLDPYAPPGQPFQQSARAGQHRLADFWRRQARDGIAGPRRGFGRFVGGRRAERDKALDGCGVAVDDGDGKAVADQAGGKVAAEMAKANEGVALAHGISGVCIICRCRSLPV
ncbi:hypothetical protein ACVWWD_000167 [Mesorhizobium sp. URHB0026]